MLESDWFSFQETVCIDTRQTNGFACGLQSLTNVNYGLVFFLIYLWPWYLERNCMLLLHWLKQKLVVMFSKISSVMTQLRRKICVHKYVTYSLLPADDELNC